MPGRFATLAHEGDCNSGMLAYRGAGVPESTR
jgi:hypothetical protein